MNKNGMGLGLTISKQIVEQMGGCIKVESEYEKGTMFSFTIQLERLENCVLSFVQNEE